MKNNILVALILASSLTGCATMNSTNVLGQTTAKAVTDSKSLIKSVKFIYNRMMGNDVDDESKQFRAAVAKADAR